MIAIANENGSILKVLPEEEEKTVCFHPLFGFVSQDVLAERIKNRARHGFKTQAEAQEFSFLLKGKSDALKLVSINHCEVEEAGPSLWKLITEKGVFEVRHLRGDDTVTVPLKEKENKKRLWMSLLFSLLIPSFLFLFPQNKPENVEPPVLEQVTVNIKPEVQKPVSISLAQNMKQATEMKRAIKQDLGFLGLLGRKDLSKAIGGAPTALKDASAGAGPGGKEGSGGEFLVGLGAGLKRVTVGNTGLAGLGGIGTKGVGGGKGGYGNSMIGSGEGKALSTIPLSQEIALEGGLDRSVVQATIAKYLSQVRACYEQGLKRNAGLGGLVTMAFEVGPMGALNYARVQKSTLGDQEVESCIAVKMKDWKFPNPRGGVSVKITYPFLLRSAQS